MKKITILTTCSGTPTLSEDNIGLLIEYATDSHFAKHYPGAIPLIKLIGHPDETRRKSCEVAHQLLQAEPHCRGIPQLTIFQEVVTLELHKAFRLLQLHDFLIKEGFKSCEFISASWWASGMQTLVASLKSPLQVKLPDISKQNKLTRCLKRILSGRFSLSAIYLEFNRALDQIDPFHRRAMLCKKIKKIEKNKPWFYSTAVTYTQSGLLYEPFFPRPFYFLIENALTGGKPLTEKKREFTWLYHFARREFIPKKVEIQQAVHAIYQHLATVSLGVDANLARNILLKSAWLELFFSRLLPQGLFSSSVFEHWINKTEPSALIVGNPVFEGYALFQARRKKIPTILLQHGLLADYFPYSDHPVDHYLVKGRFWYERLSPVSQQRALILNPPGKALFKKASATKKTIVFVTAPFNLRYLALEVDVESILFTLIQTLAESSIELVIRVHPLERVSDYEDRIQTLLKRTSSKINVSYSQGGSLDEVLNHAHAVVTFGSTVFLDCIKHNVPIISFEWHDFGFGEQLKPYKIFYFAKNLMDFSQLIVKAIRSDLQLELNYANLFLHNHSEEEIKSEIAQITGG